MIKFFRKIRPRLITENRFTKYLIYAIGEILLVMIGILLALQVNNWNEGRKADSIELKIINGLNDDIKKDIVNLEILISGDSMILESNKKLVQILKDPYSKYDESLDTLFGWINRYAFFYPQRIAYESLKSKGLEILKNEYLRSRIVNLYDFEYDVVSLFLGIKQDLYNQSNSVLLTHLETSDKSVVLKRPNNFQELKKNNEFRNYVTHIYAEQRNTLFVYRNTLSVVKNVKKDIEKELEIKTK